MTKYSKTILSIVFSILAAGITFVVAQGKVNSNVTRSEAPNCGSCHGETQDAWHNGAHGLASYDSLFIDAWAKQGQPGACLVCHVTGYDPSSGTWNQDGVSCEACHGPVNENHPAEPMPIENPEELCGQCHSEARFGWTEWQSSAHFARSMTCTICHDPHTAAIKIVEGHEEEGPSALCLNCHRQYKMTFSYSVHMKAGVNCVDCHLRHYEEGADRDIHTMPDHSFLANLSSCNKCHAEEMHTSTDPAAEIPVMDFASMAEIENDHSVSDQPSPISPYGYAGLAGLLGLAGGMILSPWLEKMYRRINDDRRKK